jgi:hypothetical protein
MKYLNSSLVGVESWVGLILKWGLFFNLIGKYA